MDSNKPRMVGINHVALDVGDIEQALVFYGEIFQFTLRGRIPGGAFLDMGDQFLALMESGGHHEDASRHFGLVVDDPSRIRELAHAAGATLVDNDSNEFLDLWGNRIQVVPYAEVQFSKLPGVLEAMGLEVPKTPQAMAELKKKGMAPP